MDANTNPNNNKNDKFNLNLHIDYRKLNRRIQTACQVKADGSLGKVMTDKDKWILHSLPFGINIGPSAFSYVLGKYSHSALS